MRFGRADSSTVIVCAMLSGAIAYGVLQGVVRGDSTHATGVRQDQVPGVGPTPSVYDTDYFAWCVPDGRCAASPGTAVCPGGIPGQACEMCQFQRRRERCDFAWTQICVSSDLTGTVNDCGTRTLGVCTGIPGTACVSTPAAAGRCARIICTSGPILGTSADVAADSFTK
jgi:hypothetical protein